MNGPDTVDFLHRMTTVNMKTLRAGEGRKGFFLTPQGKVRGYFNLWLINKDAASSEVIFEFDGGMNLKWKDDLLAVIDQFHFGEKFTLTEITDLKCLWLFEEDTTTPSPSASSSPTFENSMSPANSMTTAINAAGVRYFHHGTLDFGKPLTTVWATETSLQSAPESKLPEITFEQVEKWRIHATRAWVDHEISENTNPLEVGLQYGIAENKGCYPGQEVIEKIISLGAPARRLARLSGQGEAPSVGDTLLPIESIETGAAVSTEVGKITSVSQFENSFEALAIVKKTHSKAGLEVRVLAHNPSMAGLETRATVVDVAAYS